MRSPGVLISEAQLQSNLANPNGGGSSWKPWHACLEGSNIRKWTTATGVDGTHTELVGLAWLELHLLGLGSLTQLKGGGRGEGGGREGGREEGERIQGIRIHLKSYLSFFIFHRDLVPTHGVLCCLDNINVIPLRYGFLLSSCRGNHTRF